MASPRSGAAGGLGFRGAGRHNVQMTGRTAAENSNASSGSVPHHHARSGRYNNLSRDESELGGVTDSEMGSDYLYTVQIPATPDNQVMGFTREPDKKAEQQFVASTIFTGGFSNQTRGHQMEKTLDHDVGNHPQLAGARGPTCAVDGCDGKAMRDERGEDMTPCDCHFKICRDCYIDALNGSGKCPGCKDDYTVSDEPFSQTGESENDMRALPPPGDDSSRLERRLSLLKTNKPGMMSTGSSADLDHARWLYQTKGTYGYGNAVWPGEDGYDGGNGNGLPNMGHLPEFQDKVRKPLTRKVSISHSVLSPYRLVKFAKISSHCTNWGWVFLHLVQIWENFCALYELGLWVSDIWCKSGKISAHCANWGCGFSDIWIVDGCRLIVLIRAVVLGFFLMWRVRHQNPDAIWLWGMSVVCEIWFAFSWILDQLPKLCPINRLTDLAVLKDRFDAPSPENPSGRSDLPGVDIFVSTADPEKEPPLTTSNTILSILASEYPLEKLACYLSDDGGALLTFEALAEAASFSRIWIPFCRKHKIEPRNPETYFLLKGDPTKNKVRSDFVKDRRKVKREYDEFKVRVNGLPDSIRRRSDAYNAHEEIRAKRHQLESGGDPSESLNIPKATWMADGTHWPGTWTQSGKEHGRGDHAGIIQVGKFLLQTNIGD
jgi:hypothetical protein